MPYIALTFVLSTLIQYDNVTKSDIMNLENYYTQYISKSIGILNNNYLNDMGQVVAHKFRLENIGYHDNNIYDNVEEDIEVVTQEETEDNHDEEVEVEVEVDLEETQEDDNQKNNEEIEFIQRQFRVWSDEQE
jgi:hypothetical protein